MNQLKLNYVFISIKRIFLIGVVSLVASCTSLSDKSADTDQCREISYGKSSEPLSRSTDSIFSECERKKASNRKDKRERENTEAWFDFFETLFSPNTDSK